MWMTDEFSSASVITDEEERKYLERTEKQFIAAENAAIEKIKEEIKNKNFNKVYSLAKKQMDSYVIADKAYEFCEKIVGLSTDQQYMKVLLKLEDYYQMLQDA